MLGSIMTLSDYAYAAHCKLWPDGTELYITWARIYAATVRTWTTNRYPYTRSIEPEQAIKYR